jgi:hypothetical protein
MKVPRHTKVFERPRRKQFQVDRIRGRMGGSPKGEQQRGNPDDSQQDRTKAVHEFGEALHW